MIVLPILRSIPCLVVGIPVLRDICCLAWEYQVLVSMRN